MQTYHVTCRAAAVGVLGLLWVVTAVFTCPERCDCDPDGEVDCDGRGLTDVPANIPSDTARLFLSGNTIHSLSHADFSNLTSLAYLHLDNNNISSLPAGVFSHLTRLEELYLSHNHIADLPDGVFSNLIFLVWLDLSNNHIADLPDGVFSNLTSLEYLYLSNNNISNLPARVFSHLTRLVWLYLSHNHIADLPDGVFSHLTRLGRLYLSNNHIADLPDGVFSNLTRLEGLYLSNNHIADLPDGVFSHLTRLVWLYLSNNHIADLPDGVFSHLTSLTNLGLDSNNISSLPAGVFSHLTRLEELYLSHNHITDLPDGVFSNLTSLTDLRLSNNNISSLPADIKHLSTLTYLYITGNPWRCDCSLQDIMTSQRVRGLISDNPTCSTPPHIDSSVLISDLPDRVCNGRGDCITGNDGDTCVCNVIWTGPFCDKEVNVALGKNATQSSTNGPRGAEKAVDGNDTECAETNIEHQPWWKVDLAGFYRVSRVSILSRYVYSGRFSQHRMSQLFSLTSSTNLDDL